MLGRKGLEVFVEDLAPAEVRVEEVAYNKLGLRCDLKELLLILDFSMEV
jgi:hypothetical protein